MYAGAFLFVYMWPLIGSILLLFGALENPVTHFSFMIFGFTIYPMGGCFNVWVFTRQKCVIVMKRRSCSRLSAFLAVIAHGGDLPEDCKKKTTRRQRANSLHEEKGRSSRSQNLFMRFKVWKEKRQLRKNAANSTKSAFPRNQEQVHDVEHEKPPPKEEDVGLVDVPLESALISNGGDDLSVDEDNFGRLESELSLEKRSFYNQPSNERISSRFKLSFVSSQWRSSIPESFADDDLSVVTQTKSRGLVEEDDC